MANLIVKNIPNTITCCNLISGALATLAAFEGDYVLALMFIVIGAIFDFFDGFSARLLKVAAPIGKELDSLADDITFGLAPSAMVYTYLCSFPVCMQGGCYEYIPYLAFIIAAFSALRLAKFNLDERQGTSFIGLPTPANALFWGAFIISMEDVLVSCNAGIYIMVLLVLLSSWVLIAEIPMFALKFKEFSVSANKIRYGFLLSAICIIALSLILWQSLAGIWITILWYIILSLVTCSSKK